MKRSFQKNGLMRFLFLVGLSSSSLAMGASPCASVKDSVPVYDETTHAFKGCRLTGIAPGSLYAQVGFKNGDIVQPNSPHSPKANKLQTQDPHSH